MISRLTKTFINIGLGLVIILAASGLVFDRLNTPLSIRLFSVQSGSMQPTLPVGSLIVVAQQDSYQPGDIITARNRQDANRTFTHRVIGTQQIEQVGEIGLVTKGDANSSADQRPTPVDSVVGKVVRFVPWLGYPIMWAKTQIGFTALVIIPATLIIYTELITIKNELVARFTKPRTQDTHSPDSVSV